MPARRLLWVLLLPALAASAEEGFVGSTVCAGCHAEIATEQAQSSHRRALQPAGQHPVAQTLPRLGAVDTAGSLSVRFYRAGGQLRVRAIAAGELTDMAVDWAFGAGGQGVTLVSHLEGEHYLEHGVSFFGKAGLARTPGHPKNPKTLAEAIGLVYPVEGAEGIRGCFECHSTGPLSFDREGAAQVAEVGVGCESCHGPGAEHLGDPSRIASGPSDAAAQLELCGQCHRQPQPGERVDWQDPWNVRHAPVYLKQSPCFRTGGLGCTSCHDPHAPLAKAGTGRYRAVCGQCHSGVHDAADGFADCVSCHMPRVRPHEQLRFTNHWIGIYEKDSPLHPAGR